MNATKTKSPSKRRPEQGVEITDQAVEEVRDRLAELLPEGALDETVQGPRPEELTGPRRPAVQAGRPGP